MFKTKNGVGRAEGIAARPPGGGDGRRLGERSGCGDGIDDRGGDGVTDERCSGLPITLATA